MSLLGSGSYHMTGRFARPLAISSSKPGAGEPKCQKCLQTGHWTYECKGQAAYRSRASASKQLMNPAKRKYLDPEEVPEWMRYSKQALQEKQKQEAEARRKQRKMKHGASSGSSSSSGSDTSTPSGSGTTSTSTSGSGTTTSSSSSDTNSRSSDSGTTSSSSSSDTDSSGTSDPAGRSPPHKRTKRSPPAAAVLEDARHRPRQHIPAVDRFGSSAARPVEDAGGGRCVRGLEPMEGRVGRNGTHRSPPSPEGRRPDGRADGRAAAAAADRGGKRASRQDSGERLGGSTHQRYRSPSQAAVAGAHRHGSSPGRWDGGDERLQHCTSGARLAEQRLAATAAGQPGRHVRSLVAAADREKGGQYDEHHRGYEVRDRSRRSVSGDRNRDGARNHRVTHGGRAHDTEYRPRHESRETARDHSPNKRRPSEPAGRSYQPVGDKQPRQSLVRVDEVSGRRKQGDMAVSGRGVAQAADCQHQEPRGRHRSPSRSLSRSRSPTTSASKSQSSNGGTRSCGASSSTGTSSSGDSHSSSSGRSNSGNDMRGAIAKRPLRRGTAGR